MTTNILLLAIFMAFPIALFSQNLVPNPSFEEYFTCPTSVGGLGVQGGEPWIMNWYSMNLTPDYMHYCAGEGASNYPTSNAWGEQIPLLGDGYVALFTKDIFTNDREYVAVQLTEPLTIGLGYYVSMFASDNEGNELETFDCATNNIGIRFMKNPDYYWNSFNDNNPFTPDNFTHINYESVLNDSINWTLIDGLFIADDNYTHLVIGNFYEDNKTILEQTYIDGCVALYYIDYVCVSLSENLCNNPISVNELTQPHMTIYPNPFSDRVYIHQIPLNKINSICISNDLGQVVYLEENPSTSEIYVNHLKRGFYILSIYLNNNSTINYKLLKH